MVRHRLYKSTGTERREFGFFLSGNTRVAAVRLLHGALIAFFLLPARTLLGGEEPSGQAERDKLSKQRLDFMQAALDDFKVSSDEIGNKSAFKIGRNPLLRYNDQTRGLLDAGVWRVGETGRPTALVTMEIYRLRDGSAMASYEFVSLVQRKFSMVSSRSPRWNAPGTDLKMASLPAAPQPADWLAARLTQMRQLARRFTVHENLRGNKVGCRLLPQPIDRYSDPKQGTLDAGVFVFANGTNPEFGLILECTAKEWFYGVFRLSAAALSADIDGKRSREFDEIKKYSDAAPYAGTKHSIILPE